MSSELYSLSLHHYTGYGYGVQQEILNHVYPIILMNKLYRLVSFSTLRLFPLKVYFNGTLFSSPNNHKIFI
ncbi:unnamed protein product [Trichobilharzia regenti]|nr:unnamed protein product [Trichobilharzia regenti]